MIANGVFNSCAAAASASPHAAQCWSPLRMSTVGLAEVGLTACIAESTVSCDSPWNEQRSKNMPVRLACRSQQYRPMGRGLGRLTFQRTAARVRSQHPKGGGPILTPVPAKSIQNRRDFQN